MMQHTEASAVGIIIVMCLDLICYQRHHSVFLKYVTVVDSTLVFFSQNLQKKKYWGWELKTFNVSSTQVFNYYQC